MPTYEYECLICKNNFEAFQKISDEPLSKCPKCKGKIKKIISSGGGIIFKGSGFYATDYKKSNAKEKKDGCSECDNAPSCPAKKENGEG